MRTRLLLLFAFAAATVLMNVASAGNIAHGVEVVVIDAGHGGKFPGAHYGGVYEKDLTLKVALKLGKLVEEGMPGVKVVYTRTADRTLGADLAADLQARADIANKAGGDLFISIHANAAPRATGVRGVETLIMGESSKEQRYNENALFENNREDLIDMSDERTAAIVRAYIQNLQFTYGEYSMAFARCIQNSYLKAGRHSRGIKPQLLRVLYATDMPGVLTEIGFMSNQQELAYMKSDKGQNEIAGAMFKMREDPRVTKIGRFIRKHSIDEFPQFLNVFLGHMSVVGPRPPLPNEVAEYTEYDLQRLAVKPGITGWWQVTDRNDTDFDGMVRRDLEYIARRGVLTDMKIVVLTVIEVLTGSGAC